MSSSENLGTAIAAEVEIKKSGLNKFLLVSAMLGVTLIVAGIVVFADSAELRAGVLILGALGIGLEIFSITAAIVLRKKYCLEVFEDGMIVSLGSRRSTIRFDEIFAVQVDKENLVANGEPNGIKMLARFWTSRDPKRSPAAMFDGAVDAKNPGQKDFAISFDHILNRTTDVLFRRLKRGEQLISEGFRLDTSGIQADGQSITYDKMGMVGLFDEEICIWKRNQEMPSLRIKPNRLNALPMLNILSRRLEEDGRGDTEIPGLGRILFQKGSNALTKGVMAFLTIAALGGVALGVVAFLDVPSVGAVMLLVTGALFVALLFGTVKSFLYRFRCHEKGISIRGIIRNQRLDYLDMDEFSYKATKNYFKGAYTGTTLIMTFTPVSGKGKAIRYKTTVRNTAGDLDGLRDHISKVIAVRLHERVLAGEALQWGSCHLSSAGVRFRKSKLIGKGEELFLPFAQITGINLHKGSCHLYENGVEKSVFNMPVTCENFFPLLSVYTMLEGATKSDDATIEQIQISESVSETRNADFA